MYASNSRSTRKSPAISDSRLRTVDISTVEIRGVSSGCTPTSSVRYTVGFGAVAQGDGGAGVGGVERLADSSSGHAMARLGLPVARSGLHARIAELPDPRTGPRPGH